MQKLSDPLCVVEVAHRVTFDLQTVLTIQPLNTAVKQPWQGVLCCSSILHPQSELRPNCSKLRPDTEAHDNEKTKLHIISLYFSPALVTQSEGECTNPEIFFLHWRNRSLKQNCSDSLMLMFKALNEISCLIILFLN